MSQELFEHALSTLWSCIWKEWGKKEADTGKKLEKKLDKVKGVEIKEEWKGIVEWTTNWSKRKEKDWATWKKKKEKIRVMKEK